MDVDPPPGRRPPWPSRPASRPWSRWAAATCSRAASRCWASWCRRGRRRRPGRRRWGGWRPAGLGAEAAPALTGVLGLLGTVLGGYVGLARTALVVGLVPLGILGAHRLLAPTGSKRAQVAAAVAYAAVPLPTTR